MCNNSNQFSSLKAEVCHFCGTKSIKSSHSFTTQANIFIQQTHIVNHKTQAHKTPKACNNKNIYLTGMTLYCLLFTTVYSPCLHFSPKLFLCVYLVQMLMKLKNTCLSVKLHQTAFDKLIIRIYLNILYTAQKLREHLNYTVLGTQYS